MSALKKLPGSTTFARVYLVALFALPIVGVGAAVYLGMLSFDVQVQAALDLSTPLAWLAKGYALLFLVFSAVQIIRLTGLNFWSRILDVVGRIAHNYSLPGADAARDAADAIDEATPNDTQESNS